MNQRTTAVLLLNPDAGSNARRFLLEEILRHFSACRLRVEVTHVRDARNLEAASRSALASRPDVVIAGGGDGTLSTVAWTLAGTGVPLGILPLGTLNHFARDLGIPLDIRTAAETVCRGRIARIDVGRVNGRVFINNSSLGFYPQLVHTRDELRERRGRGKWRALIEALALVLRRVPFLDVQIRWEGEVFSRRTPLLLIGNNSYELAPMSFGVRKRLDAGHLSVHIINRTDRLGLFLLAVSATLGRLPKSRDFEVLRATHLEVSASDSRIVTVATDGELQRLSMPLVYDIEPGALSVIVPEQAAETS